MTQRGPVVAIVQARMGSTRLPGKVLAPLAGTTVLGLQLARLQRATSLDQVVVATTTHADDDAVAELARAAGATVVRGPVDDVLARYLLAIEASGAGVVVRLTADCPFTDPALVDLVVAPVAAGTADLAHNAVDGYLRGFDVEATTAAALTEAGRSAQAPHHRVHVTPWLYEHPERFRIVATEWTRSHGHLRVTVDQPEDLGVVQAVAAELADPVLAGWEEIVRVLEEHPEIAAGNAHVRQKAVEDG